MKSHVATLLFALLPGILLGASPGELKMPDFKGLEARASDSVNLSLNPWLLHLASGLISDEDADSEETKRVMKSIKSIQIRSFEFAQDLAYPETEIEGLRRQLDAPGWNRLVQTHSAKTGENVDIYLMSENQQPRGFALISSQPRAFTIINIVGTFDVRDMATLQRHFDLARFRAAAVL